VQKVVSLLTRAPKRISATEIIEELTQPLDKSKTRIHATRTVAGRLDLKYRTIDIAVDIQECELPDRKLWAKVGYTPARPIQGHQQSNSSIIHPEFIGPC